MDEPPQSNAGREEAGAAAQVQLMRDMLEEMRRQREWLRAEQHTSAKERKSERRWKYFFQFLVVAAPVLMCVVFFIWSAANAGGQTKPLPWGQYVGVVRIEGEIGSAGFASASRVVPALTSAFEAPNVKAVVLSIDSPGGAPGEAERISAAIEQLREAHPKPVVAVISNLGASAAYMVALHADRIVAGKYSLVGSIGAITSAWDLSGAMKRLDVAQNVYASGRYKALGNPFSPATPEAHAKVRDLVTKAGNAFVAELRDLRGKRLHEGVDYGSGEVWTGIDAKSIGLVDEISTLDAVILGFGERPYDFGPKETVFSALTAQAGQRLFANAQQILGMPGIRLR